MTRFTDGPAKDSTLMLKRAPFFLRVTESSGKFDALDQPGDTPNLDESLRAYKLTTEPAMCHVNMGRKGGGFYPLAEYRLIENQPPDDVMRDTKRWRVWCEENIGQMHAMRDAS